MERECVQRAARLMVLVVFSTVAVTADGFAQEEPTTTEDDAQERKARRLPDQSWGGIFGGPFHSPRVFTMPKAEVVGAYQASASGDASLLAETGTLSTTSVYAIGFGDFAHLEYRSEAASTTSDPVPIEPFTIGAQFKLPLPDDVGWPAAAVALRLGFPDTDRLTVGGEEERTLEFEEKITDAYFVTTYRFWGVLERLALSGGVRLGQATLTSLQPDDESIDRLLVLPTAGLEYHVSETAIIAAEYIHVPHFDPAPNVVDDAEIGDRPAARVGVRWNLVPPLIIDVSVGYRVEVRKVENDPSNVNELVGWDMRAGLEFFLPWGGMLCRTVGAFCE